MIEVVLAIGSNLGDRELYISSAIRYIKSKVEVNSVSSLIDNEAIGGPAGQGNFLNGAIYGYTSLEPIELLDFIKSIEVKLGRDLKAERWSERVIDIDIIFYGDIILNSDRLTIPHSLMHERDFVLIPVDEICSDFVHPVFGIKVRELLKKL